jgi:hypothetical protein
MTSETYADSIKTIHNADFARPRIRWIRMSGHGQIDQFCTRRADNPHRSMDNIPVGPLACVNARLDQVITRHRMVVAMRLSCMTVQISWSPNWGPKDSTVLSTSASLSHHPKCA